MRRYRPELERCESRVHPTLVFIFPGNAFAAADPAIPTRTAAAALIQHGDRAIQVSTPALDGPGAFHRIANYVRRVSHGRPIGLIGFSAGGSLALRLAGQPGLDVRAVADYYGPPDLKAWLASNRHNANYRYLTTHVHLTGAVVRLLSGPGTSKPHVVAAFGLKDGLVQSATSAASFRADFPNGRVYFYDGPHGVNFNAAPAAFRDFLAHL